MILFHFIKPTYKLKVMPALAILGFLGAATLQRPLFAGSGPPKIATAKNNNEVGATKLSPLPDVPNDLPDSLTLDDLTYVADADPAMQRWLNQWCRFSQSIAGATAPSQTALKAALIHVRLPESTLLAIAKCIRKYAPKDFDTIGSLAARIEQDAALKLPNYKPGTPPYNAALYRLIECKKLLWHAIEGGQRSIVPAQVELCIILRDCDPGKDPVLTAIKIRSRVGAVECVCINGTAKAQIAAAMAIDTSGMDDIELTGVAWCKGLAFYNGGQYLVAGRQFRIAAANVHFDEAPTAQAMLVQSLAMQGRVADARKALAVYCSRFHPLPSQFGQLEVVVHSAEIANSSE